MIAPAKPARGQSAQLRDALALGKKVRAMASGQAEVFEVQTLSNGRWTIHSRCRTEQQAIAEAREAFDRRIGTGVKVVKEAFDQAASLYREFTVFRLPTSTLAQGTPKNTAATKSPASNAAASNSKAPRRRRSLFGLLTNRS
jgi:hypothetical protein